MAKIAFLIPLFPLIGFLIIGFWGRRIGNPLAGIIASISVILSFIFGLILFSMFGKASAPAIFHFFEWINVDKFQVNFAYHVDQLTLIMILTVTGVAALVYIYSIGYMKHDPGYTRYFSYLNLFTAMMLILVMGENLAVMFIGWGGVGLCSYLLIGFWFDKTSAAQASRKAFVVNRIGDAGFIIAMLLLYNHFGTLSIQVIIERAPEYFAYGSAALTAITLLLFIGAIAKSAQIPLHVWLPDAMEDPVPVSALIHAATMVTAGVYIICRMNMIFLMSPVTLLVIGIIATATALLAATVALTQYNIKRILAYSTISQLGFMFIACSAGAYGAAIFHLVTHAFIKALLFLGAGAVIKGLNGEQDIRKMGGLSSSMPVTWITFLIGTLAIAGFPLMAGFFSKDLILESTFSSSVFKNMPAGMIGYLTAILTALYMFRLYYKVFRGRYHGADNISPHPAPSIMGIPLVVLAILSVFAGFLGWPLTNAFGHYLAPVFENSIQMVANLLGRDVHHHTSISWGYWIISSACFLVGWLSAYMLFVVAPGISSIYRESFPNLFNSLKNKNYIDEIYNQSLIEPGKAMFKWFWLWIDVAIIDGIVNGIGSWSNNLGRLSSKLTTGNVRNYALYMVIGLIILILLVKR